jgi:photosystem II stability/assembly factor-like uncharacterized protein
VFALAGVAAGEIYHGVAVAPNGLDAWVVNIESVAIYHTPDFGGAWESQYIFTSRRLFGVCFLDNQRGWTCGDIGTVFGTTDGGQNWSQRNLGGPKFASRIQFMDTLYGWASGGTSMLMASRDGGASWRLDYFPDEIFPTDTVDFQGLSFVDTMTGWLVAGRYPETDTLGNPTFTAGQGYIARVVASGDTFMRTLQRKDTMFDFFDVHFVDAQHGWVVGGEDSTMAAAVLCTSNGGEDWTQQSVPTAARLLRAVEFVDQAHGWACGRNGTILRTTNGGENWEYQQAISDTTLFDIDFVDSDRGMIAGSSVVLFTTDGGVTWSRCLGGVEEPVGFRSAAGRTLSIHPNPARTGGRATFSLAADPPSGYAADLRVFDVAGRTMRRVSLSAGCSSLLLDLGALAPGVYQCRVEPSGLAARLVLVGN